MKKCLIIIALVTLFQSNAQSPRNDSYSSIGILTSFEAIPFGMGFYHVKKDQAFGLFTELKFNRLNFNSAYHFKNVSVPSDTLRNPQYHGNKNLLKMITIGAVFNPQELDILVLDWIDIDFCLGIGYIQNFKYRFYEDDRGIEKGENQSPSPPLGKYYVIDHNDHGVNVNVGTNLSFQQLPFMTHLGYDFKTKTIALGFNWKVK
ncbi:hypothetical protein N9V23_03725 [Flavobacteriales bacterium]|nr:hypothetical protein [Flavobacteriales bacterium]